MNKLLCGVAALACVATVSMAQNTIPATPLVAPGAAAKQVAKVPAGPVYDESADAQQQIAAAVAKAGKNNRRVLIQWGANWCGWCKMLNATCTTDPAIKKKILYEYDVVHVDVGRFDKNMVLASLAGADLKKHGLPFLTILDGDGKPIVNQETGPLENKGDNATGHDPAKVLAFLTEHQAAYPQASDVLNAGLDAARKQHKQVFLHFGAPWCGWCHKLEDWMDQPEIGAILAKDLVDVKIDQDRTKDAKAVFEKYCKNPGGIPWFCILDADGKALCTSDGAKGNIGYPGQPEEIEHFIGMLNKARKNITEKDLAALRASLEKDNKPEQH